MPVFNTLLPTFLQTAQPHHVYRFYFAYDHDDPVYSNATRRALVQAEAMRLVGEENARRWHPDQQLPYSNGGHTQEEDDGNGSRSSRSPSSGTVAIDGSTLLVSIHWVPCEYTGKPAWAHSDASIAAFKEGADYVYRTNDDTAFPEVVDWCDRFIRDLRDRRPVANLGMVGPDSHHPSGIVTHDFVHRTHAAIFGYHYPRALPDWSSDDWIHYVYMAHGLGSKRADIPAEHRLHGQRYRNQPRAQRLAALNEELSKGVETIAQWAQREKGVTLPPNTLRPVTCC